MYRSNCRALQRRQQNAAQCIAEGQTKAALKRLGHDHSHALWFVTSKHIEFAWLDKLLPILLNHDRTFPLCNLTDAAAPRPTPRLLGEKIWGNFDPLDGS